MSNINQDLQEIIDTIASGVQTGIKTLADGFQYTDIFSFIPVFSQIPTAITGAENALSWLKDMTDEKKNDLITAVLEKLQDTSEETRNLVKRIVDALASDYMLYDAIVNYKKKAA